jgi:hypothetical protein
MRMAMGRAAVLGLIAAVLAVLLGASSQASGRATPPLTAAPPSWCPNLWVTLRKLGIHP